MARPTGRQEVKPTSVRFPPEIEELWTAVAKKMHASKAYTLIHAIEELAKAKGVTVPLKEEETK